MTERTSKEQRAHQALIVSYIITGVWVLSLIADMFLKAYEPHPTIHALMLLTAGSLFNEGRKAEATPPGNQQSPPAPTEADT